MTSGNASTLLPVPRLDGAGSTYRIAVVCLGNICRSPMAEVVLNDRVERVGLANTVEVVSAGTGNWHVGRPMDRRAAALLTAEGYDATRHRAQQFGGDWFADHDLILAMDGENYSDITDATQLADEVDRVRMFRDFDPLVADGGRDVPDPYYGGEDGFAAVLAMVERTSDALVAALPAVLASARAGGTQERAD
jgi:protein-tyrosine phosphatase